MATKVGLLLLAIFISMAHSEECRDWHFTCSSGQCVSAKSECDGTMVDCDDGSDESTATCGDNCEKVRYSFRGGSYLPMGSSRVGSGSVKFGLPTG